MNRIFPILMGIVGVAILLGLGGWQVQRLAWKEGVIAEITAAMSSPPEAIPASPDPARDAYRSVAATGRTTGDELAIFAALPDGGPGFRIIAAFEESGTPVRRILVDLGYADAARRAAPFIADDLSIEGNLHWPDEADSWTPDQPDSDGLWYARDLVAMSEALNTEPLMVVVRDAGSADTGTELSPVTTAGIKNDHLNYAITWFLLAIVWAAMSVFLVIRNRKAA